VAAMLDRREGSGIAVPARTRAAGGKQTMPWRGTCWTVHVAELRPSRGHRLQYGMKPRMDCAGRAPRLWIKCVVSPLRGSCGSEEQYSWLERTDARVGHPRERELLWMPSTRLAPGPWPLRGRRGVAYRAPYSSASSGGLKVQTLGSRGSLRTHNDNERP
jgi:hypothetical protein